MNRERLEHLIEVLSEVEDSAFNIGTWSNECGTVCCALGWAASDEEFIAQGLFLKEDKKRKLMQPFFHAQHGYYAASKFFEITLFQAMNLFSPDSYEDEAENLNLLDKGRFNPSLVKPHHVIARIKELLA